MKPYDPNAATRVWERVQNTAVSTGDAPSILNLIAEELQDAAVYQKLQRQLPQNLAPIARQMAHQEQSHAACLKGIYAMITGRKAVLPPIQVNEDPPSILLRRCYGREMRCLSQYEARQNDVQYGHIFRTLAKQEQEHCRNLLELLGAIEK